MLISSLVIACVAAVAWANGANDVSKGVATLVGSRVATYRQGLVWGAIFTVAGALLAITTTTALLARFATGLVDGAPAGSPLFPVAVAAGVFGWVLTASLTGWPVSTTHALAGAIVGAAAAAEGTGGVRWGLLFGAVAAPLMLSPMIAAALSYALHALASRRLSLAARYCICVVARPEVGLPDSLEGAAAVPLGLPVVIVNDQRACADALARGSVRLTDAAHWMAAAALSFARSLNDTPKIVAIGAAAAAAVDMGIPLLWIGGAAAMGAGSIFGGRRVTETLADRVTDVDRLEGLAASTVAAGLVLAASFVALPVSTTHVVSGAIVGIGLRAGRGGVRWATVWHIVSAWVITVPVSAAFAAAMWLGMSHLPY